MESEKYFEISLKEWFNQINTLQRKVTAIFTTSHHSWPVRVCQVKAGFLEVGLTWDSVPEIDIKTAMSFDLSLHDAIEVVRRFNKDHEGYKFKEESAE